MPNVVHKRIRQDYRLPKVSLCGRRLMNTMLCTLTDNLVTCKRCVKLLSESSVQEHDNTDGSTR